MKKIAPLLALVLLLCGCSKVAIFHAIKPTFTEKAKIQFGDFSYNAKIKLDGNKVYVTITDTNAKGLTISCDENTVTYSRNSFVKTANKKLVSPYNIAVIIYDVVTESIDKNPVLDNDKYCYKGIISAGDYVLTLDNQSKLISLEVKSANILVTFI